MFGTSDGNVRAFYANNGTSAWSSSIGSYPAVSLAVVSGNLAIKDSNNDIILVALFGGNAASVLWSWTSGGLTNIASEGTAIYYGGGVAAQGLYTSEGEVGAFPVGTSSLSGVSVYKGYVVDQGTTGDVALSPLGAVLWSNTLPSYVGTSVAGATPAVSRNAVYTIWSNGLAAQNLTSGALSWFVPLPNANPYMALAYGRLYVVAGSNVIAYGACNAPMHSFALSAIATMYLNGDPGCAEALTSAVFPSANYTVMVGNALAHNTVVANFNGASSYVETSVGYSTPASYTLTSWFNTHTGGSQAQVILDDNTGIDWRMELASANQIEFDCGSHIDIAVTLPNAITTNTWNLLTVTCQNSGSSTNYNTYLNGVLVGSGTASGNIQSATYLTIGIEMYGGSPYSPFNGLISDVQVYNTALSPTQIQTIYQRGISGPPVTSSGLAGWWPLQGDTNDYANFNTGYNNGVTFTSQNYTPPSLANAYSISKSSVLLPLLNYSTGTENIIQVGVYAWK